MGKQGPCCHCGVTSTPLWRNGPPDKPVLCNACGSRWRTKGSLANYTPMHSREFTESEAFNFKPSNRIKNDSFKYKDQRLPKRKLDYDYVLTNENRGLQNSDESFRKFPEGDMSNRSSSSSAISCSESCAQFSNTNASDLTGTAQSDDGLVSIVPSKKRTYVTRPRPSPVEKLTQDLHFILNEQKQCSNLSISSDDDLLYQGETPIGSFEIGYGSVLIRNSSSENLELESEVSSIPVNSKSKTVAIPVSSEKLEQTVTVPAYQDKAKREMSNNEKLQIVRERDSPLVSVDLKEITNFENFIKYLKHEEQHNLLKYLPSIDTANPPDSLERMFSSDAFKETLSCFKGLLCDGVFNLSLPGANSEECKILRTLVSCNLTKSKWVEFYKQLNDNSCKKTKGMGNLDIKRPRDGQNHGHSEIKGPMRSPKRVRKSGPANLLSQKTPSKFTENTREFIENQGLSCLISVPLQYSGESSDHDLLINVRRNAPSPEAELLQNGPSKAKLITNSPVLESEITEGENSLSNLPCSSYSNK